MSNELLLPEKTADLTPVQKGWIKLSEIKTDTFNELQKYELTIQGKLAMITEDKNLESVQLKIKEAKALAADAKARRMHLTKLLDEKIVAPSMEFEKRNDTLIATAVSQELSIRIQVSKELEEKNKKISEESRFKAHIQNEYTRIGVAYRNELALQLNSIYTNALKSKIPVENIPNYISASIPLLTGVPLGKFIKFERVLINDFEAKEIWNSIPQYSAAADYQWAFDRLKGELFEMYSEDLKNAEAAIEASTQMVEQTVHESNQNAILDIATENLVSQAAPFELSGGPKIKKTYEIEMEDSEQYAIKVLTVFLKNWPDASKKLGVKTWTKLVDPFAKALNKMDKQFPEFKYKEICK